METMRPPKYQKILAQALIGLVLFFNVQCAILFLIFPQNYQAGFELQGDVGAGMVRGYGILFLMWNIPYVFALIDPLKHRLSVLEAILMQGIGFLGESLLLLTLPGDHPAIRATVERFIWFDGAGWVALLAAGLLVRSAWVKHRPPEESHSDKT
jgi:hypothetical protein